jgi:hypothetical protein
MPPTNGFISSSISACDRGTYEAELDRFYDDYGVDTLRFDPALSVQRKLAA